MDRIDRLIVRATPKPSILDRLSIYNLYLGKSCNELLDYLSGDNYRAPDMKTPEWDKFMYALVHAASDGGLTE
ncbi:MAG: hypothetical protein U0I51_23595 [Muricomes sp.]|nr:hypothetical protein [Muricomes sp.]